MYECLVTLSVCLCQLSHCRTLGEAPEGSYISENHRRHLRSSRSPRKTRLAREERARGSRAGLQPADRRSSPVAESSMRWTDSVGFSDFLGQAGKSYLATIEVCLGASLKPESSNPPSRIKLFFLCKFAPFQSGDPFSITNSYEIGMGTWESFPLFRT